MTANPPVITLSIVSHGQAQLIRSLLADLSRLPQHNFEVVITINVPEDESAYRGYPFSIFIIRNKTPKGFGENHNAAFLQTAANWFAVVNPDIRVHSLNMEVLLIPFENENVAAVAPIVLSKDGNVEDSARKFPTLLRLARRLLLKERGGDYKIGMEPFSVDWVAGMFVVFRSDVFKQISGFDDRRFFMYMEDADICQRLKESGFQVVVNPGVQVTHMAQRASRRNLRHMRWHVTSAFRYLTGL